MATQPDILQDEIARRTGQGWVLVSRDAAEAQMRKPKRFSILWFLAWTILSVGTLFWVYIIWHWAKSEQLIFLRVVHGQLAVTGGGRSGGALFSPFGAWWRWAGERTSAQGKVLAYGGPVAAIVILIIIISVAASGGGEGDGDGGGEQVAGQPTEAAAVDTGDQEPADQEPAESTATPEPTEEKIERIVTAVPGAVAEADDVRITLNEIADPWVSDNQFIQPDPGRRFVAFDVTIENTGGSGTHGANIFNFRLSDAEDFAYEASFFGPEPSLSFTDLGSGQKTRGWIAFEVNEGTPLQMLKYDPRLFSTNDIEFHFQ